MSAFTDEQINTFQAFTGITSKNECKMFLEMSGGNIETAVGLFFGGGATTTATNANNNNNNNNSQTEKLPDWFILTWGKDGKPDNLPEAWLIQTLDFVTDSTTPFAKIGLLQLANGPCGALAVINALLIQSLVENKKEKFGPSYIATDEDLAFVINKIILNSQYSHQIISIALWKKKDDDDNNNSNNNNNSANNNKNHIDAIQIHHLEYSLDDDENNKKNVSNYDFILKNIDHFKAPGGLLLIIYSCIMNQGTEKINKDIVTGGGSGGDTSLIYGQFALCTSELICLLLYGYANGNVGAYDSTTGNKIETAEQVDIGLLSMDECRHGIQVSDKLKRPKLPIFLLHGIDHVTLMFDPTLTAIDKREMSITNNTTDDNNNNNNTKVTFTMYHYNGLPPNGPRMEMMKLTTNGIAPIAKKTRMEGGNVFFTPVVGQIFDIVQADQHDKKTRPKQWKTWKYEVVLALQDDDKNTLYGKGTDYTSENMPKLFQQGAMTTGTKWRCARCYVNRHKTFAFRLNDEDMEICQHCNKKKEDCGWSIWLSYNELPHNWQRSCDRQYQEKIITLLNTKWPGVEVNFSNIENPPKV